MKHLLYSLFIIGLLTSCGGPSFCDCAASAAKCTTATEEEKEACDKLKQECKKEFGDLTMKEKMVILKECAEK